MQILHKKSDMYVLVLIRYQNSSLLATLKNMRILALDVGRKWTGMATTDFLQSKTFVLPVVQTD